MSQQPSDPILQRLSRVKPTAAFLGALVVGLAGFFLPGVWGAVVLYAVVFALAWLQARTFVVTPPHLRAMRIVIICLLTVIATAKAL
jgi:hypothetical protein